MPIMKVCAEPGCGRLIPHPTATRRCDLHARPYELRIQARARANRWHLFYKSAPWRKLREVALADAGHACQRCGKGGRLDVHHVRSLDERHDLALDLDNLAVLCRPCHRLQQAEAKWR